MVSLLRSSSSGAVAMAAAWLLPLEKPAFFFVSDQQDIREFLGDHVSGAIGGGVVGDDGLHAKVATRGVDGIEQIAQHRLAVPVDDEDGEIKFAHAG